MMYSVGRTGKKRFYRERAGPDRAGSIRHLFLIHSSRPLEVGAIIVH